ncbi:hypothetical protein N8940_00510 [Sphingomonadaceae bacterium]|nr:hypothetical protein [Sphingomonadaceae bacterium]
MTLDRAAASLAILSGLLGLAHIALTFVIYPAWNLEALWFFGTGVAIVIGALANGLTLDASSRTNGLVLTLINAAMTAFFLSAWWVLPALQVLVGGLLFTILLMVSIRRNFAAATLKQP